MTIHYINVPEELLKPLEGHAKYKKTSIDGLLNEVLTRMHLAEKNNNNTATKKRYSFPLPVFLNLGFYAKNRLLWAQHKNKAQTKVSLSDKTNTLMERGFLIFEKAAQRERWYEEHRGQNKARYEFELLHFAERLCHVERFKRVEDNEWMYCYFDAFKELDGTGEPLPISKGGRAYYDSLVPFCVDKHSEQRGRLAALGQYFTT